jgi:hypothetical protein
MKLFRKLMPRKLWHRYNRWSKKQSSYNLVKVFTQDGYNYLKFPKETNMPLERFSMSMALLERLSSGISGSEMELILEGMEKALSAGLSNPKNAALVATYIHIIRERQDTIIHRDLLLNIAATWIIRDDEDPTIINNDIHKEKLEVFEKMCKEGSHDFFTRLGIEPLIPLMSMSPSDFQKLWEYNVEAQRNLIKALTHLNSVQEPERVKRPRELKIK